MVEDVEEDVLRTKTLPQGLQWSYRNQGTAMATRRVLITGASSGIGAGNPQLSWEGPGPHADYSRAFTRRAALQRRSPGDHHRQRRQESCFYDEDPQ